MFKCTCNDIATTLVSKGIRFEFEAESFYQFVIIVQEVEIARYLDEIVHAFEQKRTRSRLDLLPCCNVFDNIYCFESTMKVRA